MHGRSRRDLVGRYLDNLDWDGYGSYGLYLSESGASWSSRNYEWKKNSPLDMTIWDGTDGIHQAGDATITGTMRRRSDSSSTLWDITIELEDFKFSNGLTFANQGDSAYREMLDDLINEGAANNGKGLEWDTMTMTLTPPYSTGVPLVWSGKVGPNNNVAELHFDVESDSGTSRINFRILVRSHGLIWKLSLGRYKSKRNDSDNGARTGAIYLCFICDRYNCATFFEKTPTI